MKDVNIASREFKADPYPFYARLRAEAPVIRVTLLDKQNALTPDQLAKLLRK
jgi:cytochrome P450 PksS